MVEKLEVPIKIGDVLLDNDSRCKGRVLTVTRFGYGLRMQKEAVHATDQNGRSVRISIKRIHTDGKPRRSGFDLVPASKLVPSRKGE